MLLSALFASSCYWQLVPTASLLAKFPQMNPPAEANITLPEFTPMPERCWCDLSDSFFRPFNATRWEARALYRVLRPAVDKYTRELKAREAAEAEEKAKAEELQREQRRAANRANGCPDDDEPKPLPWYLRGHHPLTRWLADKFFHRDHGLCVPVTSTDSAPQPHPVDTQSSTKSAPAPTASLDIVSPELLASNSTPRLPDSEERKSQPWLRRYYDLSPYGIALTLDFGVGPEEHRS